MHPAGKADNIFLSSSLPSSQPMILFFLNIFGLFFTLLPKFSCIKMIVRSILTKKEVIVMNSKFLDYTLLTLVIIGAINWGLIGLFRFDLVAFIFGDMSWLSRIVYTLVGTCGLYLISFFMKLSDRAEPDRQR